MWLECHCLEVLQRWLQKYYLVSTHAVTSLEAYMDLDTADQRLGQLIWREKPKGWLIKIKVLVLMLNEQKLLGTLKNKCTYKGNKLFYLIA